MRLGAPAAERATSSWTWARRRTPARGKTGSRGHRGERPCRELAIRAGIRRFRADRTGQQHAPAARWATGIRNAEGLAIQPGSGALYATHHSRDQLAENWPNLFDWKQSARLPAEELLRVQRAGDYGWPY